MCRERDGFLVYADWCLDVWRFGIKESSVFFSTYLDLRGYLSSRRASRRRLVERNGMLLKELRDCEKQREDSRILNEIKVKHVLAICLTQTQARSNASDG